MRQSMVLALAVGSLLVACGDDTTGSGGSGGSGGAASCIQDPWTCPSGQVCWAKADQSGFECLNSGPGAAGEACLNVVGAPSCGDGLACLQLQGQAMGTCTPYCDPQDPARACPDAAQCLGVMLLGEIFYACDPGNAMSTTSSTSSSSSTGAGGAGGGS